MYKKMRIRPAGVRHRFVVVFQSRTNWPKDLKVSIGRRWQINAFLRRNHEVVNGVEHFGSLGSNLFDPDSAISSFLSHGCSTCNWSCMLVFVEDVTNACNPGKGRDVVTTFTLFVTSLLLLFSTLVFIQFRLVTDRQPDSVGLL